MKIEKPKITFKEIEELKAIKAKVLKENQTVKK
jgi:hypothetical protein